MVMFDFHGQLFEQSRKMVYEIRQGVFNFSLDKNNRVPYSLALVLDLEGPRIMTGTVLDANSDQYSIQLLTNNHVSVTNDIEFRDKCTTDRIYVNNDGILRLRENDRIYLDYGKIELVVEKVDSEEVCCAIKRGGFLGSQKVVHIPGIPIGTTELTAQDKQDIRTGIQLKVDVITVPGVKDAKYIECVKNFVHQEKGKDIDLYANIDNSVGLENIDKILPAVDGVFLHRPNLAMEIGHDRILQAQKIVLTKCNIAGKPTVVHGGYLSSMDRSTVPSNAEANDVVTTVLDGADCVYLDVTKRSAHKAHCVRYASDLCRQAEAAIWDERSGTSDECSSKIDPAHAISVGCVGVSLKSHVAAIVVITTSGLSAKIIARHRPRCPVLAIVRHGKSARKISVWRNLVAVHYIDPVENSWSRDVENRTRFALNFAKRRDMLTQGDLVLHMSCAKQNAGFANSMRLFYVSAGDFVET